MWDPQRLPTLLASATCYRDRFAFLIIMELNRWQKSILTVAAIGQLTKGNVGFEDLPPMVMESCIFWDITSCSPLKVNGCFRGIYSLYLQGGRIREIRRYLCLTPPFALLPRSLYYSILKTDAIFSSKRRLTFNELHGFIPQKTVLLM
jgi:hypothetical protein